jgi:hypothetical protein
MVIGAAGATWALVWLLAIRRSDLATQRRPSPSLAVIVAPLAVLFLFDVALQAAKLDADGVRYLAGAVGVDPDRLQAWVDHPATTLALKLAVGTTAIALAFRWLIVNTRADADGEPLPRRDFVRRFCVLVVLVVTINFTWHFFRAWLPLFLQEEHGFSESGMYGFNSAYYVAADLGSLTAGFASLGLARRGLSVHASRVRVFVACSLGTALSVAAAVVRQDWLLMALLLLIAFAALGLFPIYYSFSQELTTRHQGKVTGALGCITWMATYVFQAAVGEAVEAMRSYSLGVAVAGLAPLVGVAALVLFWGQAAPVTEKENAMKAAAV